MAYDAGTADRVRWILADHPGISEKKMFGGLSFLMRGAMCVSVSGRGGLLIRVGPEAHERLAREPHVQTVSMGGRSMTGFLRVMPEGYRTQPALKKWIKRALDYAAERPAKAAAKRKTKKNTALAKRKRSA